MAKPIKKKFFEIEIPLLGDKYEAMEHSIDLLNNKIINLDITRKLKGKGVDLTLKIQVEDGKATAIPKKLMLLPGFISHMMHKGVDYVEDSITAETKESNVIIKPFMITRKKVSRAVRRTIRNSAKNWIVDYLKTKTDNEVFDEILSNQIQKPLSLKLKKIYPLAICEIRIFEIKKSLEGRKSEPQIDEIEIKKEVIERDNLKEIKEELTEELEIETKKKKSSKKSKEEKEE